MRLNFVISNALPKLKLAHILDPGSYLVVDILFKNYKYFYESKLTRFAIIHTEFQLYSSRRHIALAQLVFLLQHSIQSQRIASRTINHRCRKQILVGSGAKLLCYCTQQESLAVIMFGKSSGKWMNDNSDKIVWQMNNLPKITNQLYLLIWMILVWRINDDSPNLPYFTPAKLSCYTARVVELVRLVLLWPDRHAHFLINQLHHSKFQTFMQPLCIYFLFKTSTLKI